MRYSHIAFDIDGTLIDTEQATLLSMQKAAFLHTGRKYRLEELRFSLGITGEDALRKLRIKDVQGCNRLWAAEYRELASLTRAFAGAASTLTRLQQAGCSLGIVTSKSAEEYAADFTPFGLTGLFRVVVCADDTARHKPDPEPLLKYLELAGADPRDTLYIGDTAYDLQCARGAGVDFALALWGCGPSRDICPDFALNELSEIPGIVGILEK
ncbi:MAG: HAD family hydrolase [Clostridia bacterium]|nr:HAD family hydrolase [Clostridia bacterium]